MTVSIFLPFLYFAPILHISFRKPIKGVAQTTWNTTFNNINIYIRRSTIFQPASPAHVQWSTPNNKRGSSYTCLYKSRFFRQIQLEQDFEKGITPIESYDTALLPSSGPNRVLTVAGAYEEAGVEVLNTRRNNEIAKAPGGTWSNAELHAAMTRQFSNWVDSPEWRVWLLHAERHDRGPGLLGIMFDQKDKQRQGCATFYGGMGGSSAAQQRMQLFVATHELGHCFNLYHSFHKRYMNPPKANRPLALSWMNYPFAYPSGEATFWNQFPFAFDNDELVHLRHAFRNDIIFGGHNFGDGAAVHEGQIFGETGLRLELSAKESFMYGEPVVITLKLRNQLDEPQVVNSHIHPRDGYVTVTVRQPDGHVEMYEPPMEQLIIPTMVTLDKNTPSIHDSAYIGYGHHGMLFEQPGMYEIQAVYQALDGSLVSSEEIAIRVQMPVTEKDREVGSLLLGDEQGMLFFLLGSDAESLAKGNTAFDKVVDNHDDHPLAVYPQMVQGFNAARSFKTLNDDNTVTTRDPNTAKAIALLQKVVEKSDSESAGVDTVTLGMVMSNLAMTQNQGGDEKAARATLTQMQNTLRKRYDEQHIDERIKQEVRLLRQQL